MAQKFKESNFNKEEVEAFRKSGMTWSKIAKYYHLSESQVQRRLYPGVEKIRETERSRAKKRELIDYKGGVCQIPGCGYNKCVSAMSFHHLIPAEKSFSIGDRPTAPMKEQKAEADKTILLCNNHHSEVHYKMHEEFMEEALRIYINRKDPSADPIMPDPILLEKSKIKVRNKLQRRKNVIENLNKQKLNPIIPVSQLYFLL